MGRFFAVAKGFEDKGVNLPQRSTKYSAGYDFEAIEDVVVPSIWQAYTDLLKRKPSHNELIQTADSIVMEVPDTEYFTMGYNNFRVGFKPTMVKTGVKASMESDEVLYLYNRSSNPKRGLVLANSVGVIDKDYFENPDNDGHIMLQFFNLGEDDYTIKRGDKIGQGIFSQYLIVDNDSANNIRTGGFGSTGR